jgi:hypothetical protein
MYEYVPTYQDESGQAFEGAIIVGASSEEAELVAGQVAPEGCELVSLRSVSRDGDLEG